MKLYRWDGRGPYRVAFTTRVGGVSEGPYASLNLGRMLGDRPEHVAENRRRLCEAMGADLARLTTNRQQHSATVNRAHAGRRDEPGDGLWTDEPGVPMLKLTADCVPIAIARGQGPKPALALVHAGWRGLSEGIVASGAAALGGQSLVAAVGPAIGPCCYEVGPDLADRFAARFGGDVVNGRHLDLWTSAERALREVGCADVDRVDVCTRCNPDLFYSHRRDGKPRGSQGVIGLVA